MTVAAARTWENRDHALRLFLTGVAAADPQAAVTSWLQVNEHGLGPDVCVTAFGKAAPAMANAVLDALNPTRKPLVVTGHANAAPVAGLEIIGAGHPLPDPAGFAAAERVAQRFMDARDRAHLVLISGGASALLPLPVAGITLADKIATTELLLASGADIHEVNTVRKHLSRLKGGGLARIAAPAPITALLLSDVLDDDPASIASGPAAPDPSTYADAIRIAKRRGIWKSIPKSVRDHLQAGDTGRLPETPKPGDAVFQNVRNFVVGSNGISLDRTLSAAREAGFDARCHSRALVGEARDAAGALANAMIALPLSKPGGPPVALISGGETTVTLTGHGMGGRNQEFALAFALAAERLNATPGWVLLSAGTDGLDGPTDAAGACVDSGSLARMRSLGIEPEKHLAENNAYPALDEINGLIRTGATGTNVADLQILFLNAPTDTE